MIWKIAFMKIEWGERHQECRYHLDILTQNVTITYLLTENVGIQDRLENAKRLERTIKML